MITIQLKAIHLACILNYLQEIVLRDAYEVTREIDSKLQANYSDDPEVLISVECAPNMLVTIFGMLSRSSECVSSSMNQDMDELLEPQIGAGLMAELGAQNYTGPFLRVYQGIMPIRIANWHAKYEKVKSGFAVAKISYTPPPIPEAFQQYYAIMQQVTIATAPPPEVVE